MSYDLFFRARRKPVPSSDDLRAYFAKQRHFQVNAREDGGWQAFYENQATGVYFSFESHVAVDPEAPASEPLSLPVAYNMNYFRPHTFGLEAEPVVSDFVRDFDLLVDDPQGEGMGEGEYSPEGFLRGWNAGNAFGYRAIVEMRAREEADIQFDALPAAAREAEWRWNYGKEEYTEILCEHEFLCGFVPTVFLMKLNGIERVTTAVVWGEAIPIALPSVELIIVPGEPLRSLWLRDLAVDLAHRFPTRDADHEVDVRGRGHRLGFAHIMVDYGSGSAPPDLLRRIEELAQPFPSKPTRLSPDQVLTSELLP